ncbi:MAG: hypothetical protein IT445_20435 [Phycisphaeraceae bacterium]|nr:hypothetical protein [Phycisphaeraceae bacterium]
MMNHQTIVMWTAAALAYVLLAISAGAVSNESFDDAAAGWSGPWCNSAELTQPAMISIDPQTSLPLPEDATPPAAGGRLVDFCGAVYRGLCEGEELKLAEDSPWYIRMALRRTAAGDADKSLSVSLLLQDGLKLKLAIGCSSSGKLTITGGDVLNLTPKTVTAMNHVYLWLIHIDAPNADGKRIVHIRSLHESQSFDPQEPTVWTLTSDPITLDGVLDRIGIAAGKNVRAEIDELRIARSWNELIGK